jgi:hypothetical protein
VSLDAARNRVSADARIAQCRCARRAAESISRLRAFQRQQAERTRCVQMIVSYDARLVRELQALQPPDRQEQPRTPFSGGKPLMKRRNSLGANRIAGGPPDGGDLAPALALLRR